MVAGGNPSGAKMEALRYDLFGMGTLGIAKLGTKGFEEAGLGSAQVPYADGASATLLTHSPAFDDSGARWIPHNAFAWGTAILSIPCPSLYLMVPIANAIGDPNTYR
jgi:hypothetical protein